MTGGASGWLRPRDLAETSSVEKRRATVVKAPGLAAHHELAGLTAFGRIEATRSIDGEVKTEVRIYTLSFVPKPAELLRIARTHWQIENGLHWACTGPALGTGCGHGRGQEPLTQRQRGSEH